MTKTGRIIATYDKGFVTMVASSPFISKTKFIYVADPAGDADFIKQYQMVFADPLVPSYDALEYALNDNMEQFSVLYTNQLQQEDALMFITTLIYAIYREYDILLYFPPETLELQYPKFLLNYLYTTFGISCETRDLPFGIIPEYINKQAELMYYNNLISPYEFLSLSNVFNINLVSKLIMDMRLPIQPPINGGWIDQSYTLQQTIDLLSQLRANLLSTDNKNVTVPFILL